MKVLFVVPDLFFSEPLGVMQLSAICKNAGHQTHLVALKRNSIQEILQEYSPDLIAYSVMTPDEHLFEAADRTVRSWAKDHKKQLTRIMGGPHPTFFPEVVHKLDLDAICLGDGDNAILRIINAIQEGKDLSGIPNVATQSHPDFEKEVVEDLDSLPYLDRDLIYDSDPDLQKMRLRSFLTQKGCPYKCTYCFNHSFNQMFKGGGRKLLRRRSVDNLIDEIQYVIKNYPEVKMIRFADDVFVIRRDAWLEEFAEKYPKKVGIPFYCLIRSNSLTEEAAQLLAKSGCRSVGMSIEAGDPELRNVVLKRNMSNELVEESFRIARKYGIRTYSNTLFGIPGTTLEDDFQSFLFAKKVKPAAPTFGIFCPFPKSELTDYAIELGVLD
ncbi:MAG: B12-binding domain-containing radical SAM protein, partial [Nitrospinales bacterium]